MNLIGQKFHRLLVLADSGQKQKGCVMWECLCDCGNTKLVRSDHLKADRTKSCGCQQRACRVDLSGNRFGKILVLSRSPQRKNKSVMWNCVCDCGKEFLSKHYNLTSGHQTSCGCKQGEWAKEKCRKSLIGKKFGRILVVKESNQKLGRRKLYECVCDCGNSVLKTSRMVRLYQSCGCLKDEILIERITTHGESKTRKYKNAHRMKRICAEMQRTPKWADLEVIRQFYKECPDGYHVDHILPLQGELISGLHVIENLQHLPAQENMKKNNKFIPFSSRGKHRKMADIR